MKATTSLPISPRLSPTAATLFAIAFALSACGTSNSVPAAPGAESSALDGEMSPQTERFRYNLTGNEDPSQFLHAKLHVRNTPAVMTVKKEIAANECWLAKNRPSDDSYDMLSRQLVDQATPGIGCYEFSSATRIALTGCLTGSEANCAADFRYTELSSSAASHAPALSVIERDWFRQRLIKEWLKANFEITVVASVLKIRTRKLISPEDEFESATTVTDALTEFRGNSTVSTEE